MPKRTADQRTHDALRRLKSEPNVWIATASMAGVPHMVPLSLAWVNNAIVVATPTDTPTVRNANASGQARATLDDADDVVIIDADVRIDDFDHAQPSIVDAYVSRVGWDPRNNPGNWSLLTLTPRRVQSWNSIEEISGRTVMRDGVWTGPASPSPAD